MSEQEFTVRIVGFPHAIFDNAEHAFRLWDSISFRGPIVGSISVKEWDATGNCVRDGNLLHVSENGAVYISPTLKA